ncbi:MAG: hypothetical protein ACE3JP_08840 [Ectobacillus sp.]
MQKKINIESAQLKDHALIFCAADTEWAVEGLQPKRHMLVDSDQLAFLYILENEVEFVYVSIPHTLWPQLKEAQAENKKVYIVCNGLEIELKGLQEELEYLVQNIEGNANYGEQLVNKVEEIFLA